MNRFHNYFAGQKEYASTSDNVLVVERGTTGVALINYNRGSKKVSIEMHRMVDGTYTDQISGTTFTVSDGVLTGPKAVITLPAKKVVSYKKILKRKGVSDSVTFKSKKY